MIRKSFLILLCAALVLLCGCSEKKETATTSTALTDYPATAFDITLKECPQKVISLSPEVTDIIIALGSDAQLAGISDNCVSVRELSRFGTSVQPDIEAIKKAEPDLVFVSGMANDDDIADIKGAGISVAKVTSVGRYTQLSTLYTDIAVLMSGGITGVRNAANTFADIDSEIKRLSNSDKTSVTAAVFITDTVTLSDGCIAAELAAFAGIDTLLCGADDEIIEGKPDIILCPKSSSEAFKKRFEGIKTEEFDMTRFDRRGSEMAQTVADLNAVLAQ